MHDQFKSLVSFIITWDNHNASADFTVFTPFISGVPSLAIVNKYRTYQFDRTILTVPFRHIQETNVNFLGEISTILQLQYFSCNNRNYIIFQIVKLDGHYQR